MNNEQKPLQQRRAEALARIIQRDEREQRQNLIADLTIFGMLCAAGLLVAFGLVGICVIAGIL